MEKVSLTFRKDNKNERSDKEPSARQNVSFKFSKQLSKALTGNRLNEDENVEKYSDRELVSSIEDKEIRGSLQREQKKNLVIRPIHKNVWRHPSSKSSSKNEEKSDISLEEQAVKELLKETAIQNEKWEKREFSNYTVTIPMVMQNKIPDGYETENKLDVACRPEESKLDDYDSFPVEEFGTALLRGLGCNPGDPVGNKNRQVVKPIETVVRSKGLGLGADIKPNKKNNISHSKDEAELKLVVGAYVYILQGFHEGHYGEVEGLDESRVIIKLSRQNKNISLPHLFVEVVSKKEFKKESKVLNKSAYEEYNRDHDSRNERDSKHSSKRQGEYTKHSTQENLKENSHLHTSSKSKDVEQSSTPKTSHRKRKHSAERSSSNKHSANAYEDKEHRIWVYPLLRVRFIDKQYKKGKYFNQKMTVEDVLSSDSCVCRTEDGKYLDDINPDMLETVVPRTEINYVMVVEGKYKGQDVFDILLLHHTWKMSVLYQTEIGRRMEAVST